MKCKLGDVCEVIGGGTPRTTVEEYWNGDIAWITPKDLSGYVDIYIANGERNITKQGLDDSSAQLLPKGAVLLTSRAPIGYIAIASNELCTNQGFKSFVVNENKLSNLYLYYWLKHNKDFLQSIGTGTTFMEIPASRAKEIEIDLPPLATQQKIAATLSCLDAKIANNTKINHHLEQMAQAIFKSWLVDFEPWGGVMPEDWREGTLSDVASITSGKRPSFSQQIASDKANVPLIGASSIMGFTDKFLYDEKILITGRVGTHGIIRRYSRPCWASDNTLIIKSNYYEFTYQQLCSVDFYNMNRGSTQPLITQTDLKNVIITLPSKAILLEFEKLSGSLMERHESNIRESENLAKLRDTLLPRLISGELSIIKNVNS